MSSHQTTDSHPVVAFVTMHPAWGGSQLALLELMAALDGRVERWLIAPSGPFLESALVSRRAEKGLSLGRRGPRPVRYLSSALHLAGFFLRHRPKITVVHCNGTLAWIVASAGIALARVPAVVWVHEAISGPYRDRVRLPLTPLARRVRWVAVSPVAEEFVVATWFARRDKSAVVPNPIEQSRLGDGPSNRRASMRVCYLSNCETDKGFRMLPETIRATSHLAVHWCIVASEWQDGTNADVWAALRSFDEERVTIHRPRREVAGVYERCDIVFVPSHVEAFGRIVAEAMTLGIPVVASDIPAFRWLLGDERAGLLFPVDDAVAAAGAIERLVSDPDLRARVASEGRKRAKAFEPHSVAEAMLEQYRTAVGAEWAG